MTPYLSTQALAFSNVYLRSMSQQSVPADPAAKPASGPAATPAVDWNFPVSPIPPNPLGEGKYIKRAAALIIGYG